MVAAAVVNTPYREVVIGCAVPSTFKYFFSRDEVDAVWRRLESAYGTPAHDARFGTLEVRARRFILRATALRNPITVFRRRGCTDADLAELHRLFGFREGE